MHTPSRRDVSVATIALALLAAAGKAQAQTPANEAPLTDDQIRVILAQRIKDRESVGMIVGVISPQGRRIVAEGKLGLADTRVPTANTIFGIASASKAFTGLLLADAVRRKEIKLGDPVARYLPPSVKIPSRNNRAITLADLATHTTGLPHDLPNDLREVAAKMAPPEARAVMYDFLAKSTLPFDTGTYWAYSNLDYTLIGYALEQRTGLSYDQLLRTRILDPLGMSDTGISISPAQYDRRAHPHTEALAAAPEWNKPWSVSVLQSTANDLLTFLGAAMGLTKTPLAPSFAEMLTVRRPAPMINAEQAVGWYISPFKARPLIVHSGSGGGFGSTIIFDPAIRTGVVLLSNAENLWEDVARHILRPSQPMAVKKVAAAIPDAVLNAHTGRYADATGAAWIVVREPDGLLLRHPQGYRVPLVPDTETRFTVPSFPTLFVTFQRDAAGKTTSLTWSMAGDEIVAKRAD